MPWHVHGRLRFTQDIDIWVEHSLENVERLFDSLTAFCFPADTSKITEFAQPERMVTLGKELLRVNIMTSIAGVLFHETWKNCLHVSFTDQNHPLAVIGLVDFMKNKKATGRTKDLLDLERLKEGRE